jgi:hypothetical protein
MQEENEMAPAASSHTEIQIRPTSLSASSRQIRNKELGYFHYKWRPLVGIFSWPKTACKKDKEKLVPRKLLFSSRKVKRLAQDC